MTESQERMLQSKFNALPQDQKNKILQNNKDPKIAPIILWAMKVLAAAGLSWLASKLLNWGAHKFCKAYRNSNSVTKWVCSVID
ncbi:hypothetical protein RD055328_12640 [Companilactobacillus sp. RD055328]|uniref:hypothetical protein n=1 Tax=Companilactobacillus sp. RD055328 TaxID=2916634 RepID=UPI001FC7DA7A|nr:hypothetical protein [Companilactobacillus sp. RD055328]GKQ43341.1 hypothetical protein RD055328_12640 [Companilactobacillus sp. RD055328]